MIDRIDEIDTATANTSFPRIINELHKEHTLELKINGLHKF